MQARGRVAVVLGDEAARVGLVAADQITELPQGGFDRLGDGGDAARSVAIAQHDIGARAFLLGAAGRGHGMAVDQRRGPEFVVDVGEQFSQRPVIRLVQAFDPPQRVIDGKPLVVDFLGIADHPRHGAEPARDPHRTGIGEGGQPPLEHARIELVRLAVDVDIAAREMHAHQRLAAADHPADELVDEGILRTAQRGEIEPRGRQERARVNPAAVRGIEHEGRGGRLRFEDFERRVELGHDWIAHRPKRPLWRARFRARLSRMRAGILHCGAVSAKRPARFTRYLPPRRLMG